MMDEFVEKFNKLSRLASEREKLITQTENSINDKEVLKLNRKDINNDLHYIARSILEENDRKKIFVLKRDRTPDKSMIFLENGKVKYRYYQHKYKNDVDWLDNNNLARVDDIMPKNFIDMLFKIRKLVEDYQNKILEKFYEAEDVERMRKYGGRRGREKELVILERKYDLGELSVYHGGEINGVYQEILKKPVKRSVVTVTRDYYNDSRLKFKIKFFSDKKINEYGTEEDEELDYRFITTLTDDNFFAEINSMFRIEEDYCEVWIEERLSVYNKIEELISEHGYMEVLAVSKL